MNEWDRLRDDWVIGRGENGGWVVNEVVEDYDGDFLRRLGYGKTIVEAIDAAEAYVAKEERERAERHADFERRKAAGELTPLEIAGSYIPAIWNTELLQLHATPVLFETVMKDYEGEVATGGDVVRIESFQDVEVSTERGNGADLES